jgi:hypothetical protein
VVVSGFDLLRIGDQDGFGKHSGGIGTLPGLAQGGGAVTIKNKELIRITKYKELKLHKL